MNKTILKRTKKNVTKKNKTNEDPVKNILIFGDSNTWGLDPKRLISDGIKRLKYEDRWTTKLQKKLGSKYNIIVESLLHRTTIFNELCSPSDGDFDCIGRNIFKTILHSHKPLSLVIIALSTNDMKDKFNTTPNDIGDAIRVLVKDMERSTDIGITTKDIPKCIILAPPIIRLTPLSKKFGFSEGIEDKSKAVSAHLATIANDLNIGYLNLGEVAEVSPIDGVNFDKEVQKDISIAVASKIKHIMMKN
jgi:lysophospholipase L1-like esterase